MADKKNLDMIKPSLVLTSICVIISVLIVVIFNITYVDTTGIITDKMKTALTDMFGDGSYTMLMTENEKGEKIPQTFNNQMINSIIVDEKGEVAFYMTGSGYNKDSLNLIIGFDTDGKVCDVSIVSISETPGVGTKVNNDSFLDQFVGINNDKFNDIIYSTATYSSKGINKLVKAAVSVYNEKKGEILSD